LHSADEFLAEVAKSLGDIRPVNVRDAVRAVFRTIDDHVERGQIVKVRDALPKHIRSLWPLEDEAAEPLQEATGRDAKARPVPR
jgi:uncharacterized protein (DUF2267 family)